MTGIAVEISSNKVRKSALTFDTKNAWASYVRNRWITNTLWHIQEEWSLSEGEARGVLYGQASQRTIDKINDHKNGGFMLALHILCLRFRTTLEDAAIQMEEAEARERDRTNAEQERRRAALRLLETRKTVGSEDRP